MSQNRMTRQPIRFQEQLLDEESGFYYNRYRYYDPRQGRYITQDPIGLEGGVNGYAYPTDPVSYVDPLGLQVVRRPILRPPVAGRPAREPLSGSLNDPYNGSGRGSGRWWGGDDRSPDALSKGHHAAKGNRYDSRYGGNCDPNRHDKLRQAKENACEDPVHGAQTKANKGRCFPEMSFDGRLDKLLALTHCYNARKNIADQCFAGGDKGHHQQLDDLKKRIKQCGGSPPE